MLGVIACQGDAPKEPELRLLEGERMSEELARLRTAQMVRVVDNPVDGDGQSGREIRLVDRDEFKHMIGYHCRDKLLDSCAEATQACGYCDALEQLCLAHVFLDAAGLQPEPMTFKDLDVIVDVAVLDSGGNPIYDRAPDGSLRLRTENVLVDDWELGSQSNATNAQLAELASLAATSTMYLTGGYIANSVAGLPYGSAPEFAFRPCDLALLEGPADPSASQQDVDQGLVPSLARATAQTYAEAYSVLAEATGAATDNIVAAADAQLSHPSRKAGRDAMYRGLELSRVAAATRLVGIPDRQEPINSPDVPGLCTEPPPGGPSLVALNALRDSGIPPSIVLDEQVSTSELVDGPLPSELSVRERLAEVWQRPELLEAGTRLADGLNVAPQAFQDARAFLREEHRIYARTDRFLAKPPRGVELSFDRYASVVTPAAPLPSVYFATLANAREMAPPVWYTADPGLTPYLLSPYQGEEDAPWYASQQMDAALALASALISGGGAGDLPDTLLLDVSGPLGGVLLQGQSDRRGRVQKCENLLDNDIRYIRYSAWGYTDADGLAVVSGEDGLRCAIHGSVDGVPCTEEMLGIRALMSGTAPEPTAFALALFNNELPDDLAPGSRAYIEEKETYEVLDFAQVARAFFDPIAADVPFRTRLYVVKPRLGESPGVPGAYEPVVGGYYRAQDPTTAELESCEWAYVFPHLNETAGNLLAPSTASCDQPAVECDGTLFDERMPLEDELSEDFDGVESSWRHYLALAEQSAQEADLLGEAYIQEALDFDIREADRREAKIQRAEAAMDELQRVCGTAVDSRVLLEKFAGPDLELSGSLLGEVCESEVECETTEDCVAGRCIKSIKKVLNQNDQEPDVARLAECLAGAGDASYVAMGTKPVCFWRRSNNPNYLCEDPDPQDEYGGPCPALCSDLGDDGLYEQPPAGTPADARFPISPSPDYTYVQETLNGVNRELLGYFDSPRSGPTNWQGVCDSLSMLRDAPDQVLLEKVAATNKFTSDKVVPIAERIGWRPQLGGYSAIYLDDQPRYTTGHPDTGPAEVGWPCATEKRDNCPTDSKSLFCMVDAADCLDPGARAETNYRMLEAVLAVRATTAMYPSGVVPGVWLPRYGEASLGQGPWNNGDHGEIQIAHDNRRYRHVQLDRKQLDDLIDIAGNAYITAWDDPENDTVWWHVLRNGSVRALPGFPFFASETDFRFNGDLEFAIGDFPVQGWDQRLVGLAPGADASQGIQDPFIFWAGMSNEAAYDSARHPEEGNAAFGWIFKALSGQAVALGPGDVVENGMEVDGCFVDPQSDEACNTQNMNIIAQYDYSLDSVLDGVELLCRVAHGDGNQCGRPPPDILSIDDLKKAAQFLECAGDEIQARAALGIFANVPSQAVDALRKDSVIGAYPAVGGDFGEALTDLRGALIDASEAAPLIAENLRGLGRDIDQVRLGLAKSDIRNRIDAVQFQSTVTQQLANCASAVGQGVSQIGGSVTGIVGGSLTAAATCLNSAAQISFGRQLRDLQGADTEIEKQQVINGFVDSFETRGETLRALALQITRAQERIDGSLARLESLQNSAARALSQALTMDSREMEQQYRISSAMRTRLNTSRIRYEKARKAAIRMAFLAKRAIELRIGLRLADIGDDLPLVEAPSSWESTVCTSTGVDYASLAVTSPDGGEVKDTNFADAFVGDYVSKLGRVIESYRLVNNFHEGTDTAVVSLRDDIQRVRASCDVEVGNLLYQAGQLDTQPTPEDELPADETATDGRGWVVTGCVDNDPGAAACVQVSALPVAEENVPFDQVQQDLSTVGSFRVTFGTDLEGQPCSDPSCEAVPESALVQRRALAPGVYRLSWYGRPPPGAMADDNPSALVARGSGGDELVRVGGDYAIEEVAGYWNRYHFLFELEAPDVIDIAVVPIAGVTEPHQRDLAAPMLENVSRELPELEEPPQVFMNTGDTLTRTLEACEDTDGLVFRNQGWRRDCVRLCADGFASTCSGGASKRYCYRETSFHISQRDIEANRIFKSSGFARGNFNYRIESIGINFVGSETRDCAESETPSTCYSSAFIPYSLVHSGPYYIRNHFGDDYEGKLFTGRIEHARGLAAERYLTNPLSSSDQELINQYLRNEFQGRPLDGTFILRVWEEPGVSFEAIADAQIVLNYRYWTRFD